MIRKAEFSDIPILTGLALKLWPDNDPEGLAAELTEIMKRDEAAFFLAEGDVGFAQCQLRHDYVEGTESSPVGYLEGIFVEEAHRGRGIAGQLLAACENWAKTQGCREFASDCELGNDVSRSFHLALGFAEANRIICFTKSL